MDSSDLSPALLKAGQEYLDAMRILRLNPEGLLWARVDEIHEGVHAADPGRMGDWHLVLITSAIDVAGPSALNELLFKAYDAAATPKDISPFIVEVMSLKSPFVAHLLGAIGADEVAPFSVFYMPEGGKPQALDLSTKTNIGGLWFDRKWIYHLPGGAREKTVDRKRHWREFSQSVNALAA